MQYNSFPYLLLDATKAKKNIKVMSSKASKLNLKFRPHFKTHQSLKIGNWFKNYPIDGITVSSLKMAEYFANNNWSSITVAFPVNILELERINKIASSIDLRMLIVDSKTIEFLEQKLTSVLGIYIEIDPGYGRSGVHFSNKQKLNSLIQKINSSKKMKLYGFYSHAGHSYKSRSKEEIKSLAEPIIKQLSSLKEEYNLPVCFGDTPSCSILEDFGEIDEISPGNFVFYDWIQTQIGSCSPSQIAVAVACTVVAKYESRNELLIHGGAVHFSKDFDLRDHESVYYGQVVNNIKNGWGEPIKGSYLKSISQEHGIVSCTQDFFNSIEVGDIIKILPIHSCLTADLMGGYISTDDEIIDHLSAKKI